MANWIGYCQKELEDEIAALKTSHEEHRKEAQLAHTDHMELTKQCKEGMTKIKTLQENTHPSEEQMENWNA